MKSYFKPATLLITLVALIGFSLSSCESEAESGPKAEGINGLVEIYNVYGEKQDPSGVTVSIEQTGKTTKTDNNGSYWLPYLETGTYTLKFSKESHPTTYVRDIEHKRTKYTSTPAPAAKMLEPSSYYITQAAVVINTDDPNNPYFHISAKLNKPIPTGKEIKVKMYLGKDASVSLTNYVHNIMFKTSKQDFEIIYPYFASLRINNDMKRGDMVYMVIYTDAIEEDKCDGTWSKPDCSNSSTLNSSNPIVFSEIMP